MHPIAEKVRERFPEAFIESRETLRELSLQIRKEYIVPVCRFLHDDPELDFDHITDICSVDFPEDQERFEVVYHFYSIRANHRIRLKARVSEENCVIDSVCGIWQGANFLERETYDMMGIVFRNHPDFRRILMTDDFEGWPLRKDFPTEGRGWRETFEFLPKPAEETEERR
jgi:NADH-quinone oxidoreductase subunit C